MAEAGVSEAAMQSIAGHLSKKMLDHYSHVRLAAKRQAVQALGGGLIMPEPDAQQAEGKANSLTIHSVDAGLAQGYRWSCNASLCNRVASGMRRQLCVF